MYKQNRHKKTYDADFKLSVVKALTGDLLSIAEAAARFGISSSMVRRWRDAYQQSGESGLEEKRGKKSTGRPRKYALSLEEENHRLRLENEILKKSISILEQLERGKNDRCSR